MQDAKGALPFDKFYRRSAAANAEADPDYAVAMRQCRRSQDALRIATSVGSSEIRLTWLERSYHGATLDY